MLQSTIARRVAWTGTGLHSGDAVEIALCPADADSGIVFVSLGAAEDGGDLEIPACAETVLSTSRATTLAARGGLTNGSGARIATVEHLLATLFALGIDNVRIEVRGSEIPVMDGSAAPLVDWVRLAGRETQNRPRTKISVSESLEIREGDRWIRIDPAEGLRISYAIDFAHPSIGRQNFEIPRLDEQVFERELAAARTFGFVHEVEALREAGLAHGGSFENTIVLDESGILNTDGLRWPDEFVRHKIIDLLGDLALLGGSLEGHVQVEKGGHRLHHRLVRALKAPLDRSTASALDSSPVLERPRAAARPIPTRS